MTIPAAFQRPTGFQSEDLASLEQYLADVRRYSLLTCDEEVALARRVRAGDEDATGELASRNLRFVITVARKYRGYGLPLMDLISEGNGGLLTAAHKFDPNRGVRFITYAVWWVRQAMLIAIAKQAHVVTMPVGRSLAVSRVARATRSLTQALERQPSPSEVAELCELSIETVESYMGFARLDVSLDAPLEQDGGRTLLEELAVEEQASAGDDADEARVSDLLRSAVRNLPPREARILRLAFGLDGEREHSLEEVGSMLGITRERVRQIRDRALRRIRRGTLGRALAEMVS